MACTLYSRPRREREIGEKHTLSTPEAKWQGWRDFGRLDTWTMSGERPERGPVHVVPLSEPARDLLGGAERTIMSAAMAGTEPAPLVPWSVHDLRRTVATGLERR
jgi:hypothetical protein